MKPQTDSFEQNDTHIESKSQASEQINDNDAENKSQVGGQVISPFSLDIHST